MSVPHPGGRFVPYIVLYPPSIPEAVQKNLKQLLKENGNLADLVRFPVVIGAREQDLARASRTPEESGY
jgi:hypothetical protein